VFYNFPLSATGGSGSYTWTWAAAPGSSIPDGLSLAGNLIAGTPTVGTVGRHEVVISVSDSAATPSTATKQYTITIVNPAPPVVAALPGLPGATLNQPYSYQFQASGLSPVSFSASGALPPGITPLATTGILAGVPSSANSYPITVYATDAAGQRSAAQAFTLNVFSHGFSPTADMISARAEHTATLLANGDVLIVGGNASLTSELFNPTTGRFTATGALQAARAQHTATLLCDLDAGPCTNPKVLVVGGGPASAELYDPTTGTFTLTAGSPATARVSHTATLLLSGKVLIAGGTDNQSTFASAELFDPATGTFTATAGPMSHDRMAHTATLLPDGKVLIAGGDSFTTGYLDSAELYDPVTSTFSDVPSPMTVPRYGHTATLLLDGRVLIAGGAGSSDTNLLVKTAEIYDPAAAAPASSFTRTGEFVTRRSFHAAARLPSGKVLMVGGWDLANVSYGSQVLQHAELYDPVTGLFTSTGGMLTGRISFTLTPLSNGSAVLATGGSNGLNGEAFVTAETYQ
jgi:hypothetical protein